MFVDNDVFKSYVISSCNCANDRPAEITVKTVREKLENKGCRDPCRPLAKGGPLVVQRTGESVSLPLSITFRLDFTSHDSH